MENTKSREKLASIRKMLIETGHLSDADLGHQRHKIVVRTGEMAHMAAARGRNMSGQSCNEDLLRFSRNAL